jgi:hypothetical protein
MSDITNYRLFNIPVFMYSMIGLTLGIITFSTLNDDTSNTVTSGIIQESDKPSSSSPSGISGGKQKTPKHSSKQKHNNRTQKSK